MATYACLWQGYVKDRRQRGGRPGMNPQAKQLMVQSLLKQAKNALEQALACFARDLLVPGLLAPISLELQLQVSGARSSRTGVRPGSPTNLRYTQSPRAAGRLLLLTDVLLRDTMPQDQCFADMRTAFLSQRMLAHCMSRKPRGDLYRFWGREGKNDESCARQASWVLDSLSKFGSPPTNRPVCHLLSARLRFARSSRS